MVWLVGMAECMAILLGARLGAYSKYDYISRCFIYTV